MIYWPAEVTNLSECHEPLIEYIDRLRPPGRKSAKDFFNAEGWIVNTMNNPFGYTAPGWGFPWGFFPVVQPGMADTFGNTTSFRETLLI